MKKSIKYEYFRNKPKMEINVKKIETFQKDSQLFESLNDKFENQI